MVLFRCVECLWVSCPLTWLAAAVLVLDHVPRSGVTLSFSTWLPGRDKLGDEHADTMSSISDLATLLKETGLLLRDCL